MRRPRCTNGGAGEGSRQKRCYEGNACLKTEGSNWEDWMEQNETSQGMGMGIESNCTVVASIQFSIQCGVVVW